MNKYQQVINGHLFNLATKDQLVEWFQDYAEANMHPHNNTISIKDYNNIFRLQHIKEEYLKSEIIKRLSQKTIVGAINANPDF